MNNPENEVYMCTRMRLLSFLSEKGLKPFGTIPDRYNPSRVVWLYKNSPQLHDAVEEYYSHVPVNR